jgi:hypothetical protein
MFDEYRFADEGSQDWGEGAPYPSSVPLPFNIGKLLSGLIVEWGRLELKRGWNPLSVLHTLCAFANDFHNLGGGFVLIGIAEHPGRSRPVVVGLSPFEVDAIQKEILQLGNCAIRPQLPRPRPVLAPRAASCGPRDTTAVPQPAHRRIPQGVGADRRTFHGGPEDFQGHEPEWLATPGIRLRRRL